MSSYSLKNNVGCHFKTVEANSFRASRAKFAQEFTGQFKIENEQGETMIVNLK